MKNYFMKLIGVTAIFALLISCGVKKEAETTTLKEDVLVKVLRLGHVTQTSHPFHLGAIKFAELVEKNSGGKLKIEIFPARQLGDDRELLEQIMNGTLDMGVISSPLFSSYTPLLDSLQLPFLLNTYNKEKQAVTSPEMKAIFKSLESLDLKAMGIFEGGMRHLANNLRPIKDPKDMNGLKLRVVPSKLILRTIKTLGANPTPMAYGEVYTALQTNVIDGEEVNITSVYSEKHYEVIKYITVLGLFPFPGINVMNLNVFEKLTSKEQQIVENAVQETVLYVFDQFEQLEIQALQTMESNNVQINHLTDISPFMNQTTDIYKDYESKDKLIKEFITMAKSLK